jgi:hypothetical protein
MSARLQRPTDLPLNPDWDGKPFSISGFCSLAEAEMARRGFESRFMVPMDLVILKRDGNSVSYEIKPTT